MRYGTTCRVIYRGNNNTRLQDYSHASSTGRRIDVYCLVDFSRLYFGNYDSIPRKTYNCRGWRIMRGYCFADIHETWIEIARCAVRRKRIHTLHLSSAVSTTSYSRLSLSPSLFVWSARASGIRCVRLLCGVMIRDQDVHVTPHPPTLLNNPA